MSPVTSSRRGFLLRSGFAAGAWTLGLMPALAEASTRPTAAAPLGFDRGLRFEANGRLTVLSHVIEMGQGTQTSIGQIAAEELDMALDQISVAQAPVRPEFASPGLWPANYATYGSFGLPLSLREVGTICAAARSLLIQAAAQRWGVDPQACRTRAAQVWHPDGSQRLPYTRLLEQAAGLPPPAKPQRKPREQWQLLGHSTPRPDLPAKVDGSARFGIDARRPGMLVATLMHAPRFGAELLAVDEAPALAIKGVQRVVRLPGALAVVAKGYWQALQGLRALQPRWSPGPHAGTDSAALRQELLAAAERGAGLSFAKSNDPAIDPEAVALELGRAKHLLDLRYDVPFLAHATMEPMNALAEVGPDRAELWLSTQSAQDTQHGVAKALGLAPDKVTIHPLLIGGGFGRRLEHGFAVEAALLARAMGRPVQLIWSRETDMRAGGYRPAAAARVRLALGADGLPTALRVDCANPSLLEHSRLSIGRDPTGLDWSVGMGWLHHDYALGPKQLGWTRVDAGVPCGFWRSVGASQNVFFLECTIDRAAKLAGLDPLVYRLRLLAAKPQTQALLKALAERAGWGQVLPKGQFRGLAMSAGNAARSAHIVHISVPAPGRFRIEKIYAAVDAGVLINPDAVEAQLMGGTLFGLTAALAGEITLKNGEVQQGGFDDYPLLTLAQTPPLDVLALGLGQQAIGVGEEGPASIGPALANALFAASGVAIERLPLSRAGWQLVA
ncbi:xanthine dehydrogenase family protein molybdopterin-binding subunit [Paucibacter sp. XJ19-41]|uniref:xanthine dehydrogenase family protein molybdopterin-binding subunit n=1 Tax=Paucibacter sp. XJ19-41 TaxID=2927824 RepID=UPI00234912C2|nr:molybdopterin cofactor-binding domain-containing protein [Paucibacter sp. XJ19-41]MDC6169745.1 molybdopterin-dependent oxidoreductase [Paucibacter sp. XJ19-41]